MEKTKKSLTPVALLRSRKRYFVVSARKNDSIVSSSSPEQQPCHKDTTCRRGGIAQAKRLTCGLYAAFKDHGQDEGPGTMLNSKHKHCEMQRRQRLVTLMTCCVLWVTTGGGRSSTHFWHWQLQFVCVRQGKPGIATGKIAEPC